jgi:glycine dehydrogenase subunit 1
VIYEYQSMMCALTGMEVSNASLYDGASALAEACLTAVRANRRSTSRRILVPRSLNPTYLKVAQAIAGNQNLEFESVDYERAQGRTSIEALRRYEGQDFAALVVQQPNFFGVLEETDELTDWAHAQGMLLIAVVNPISLGLLKAPGQWGSGVGADVVCGEGQPLGVPLSSGGPYFGFMTTRMQYVRQMPGRVVGRTLDTDGRPGFTLTLQAREQHIRRGKANSNICTNQGLTVTAATIYMSLLGAEGLARVATASLARTRDLVTALTRIRGVRAVFAGPRFHEAVLSLDRPVPPVLAALAERGILGGLDISEQFPELGSALLVCATETKTDHDIARYARTLAEL